MDDLMSCEKNLQYGDPLPEEHV